MIYRSKLENGLNFAIDPIPSLNGVSLWLIIGVGSGHEANHEAGLAHFVEHLLFRSEGKNQNTIHDAVADLGGKINAYTHIDHTAIEISILREDLPAALSILGELLANCSVDQQDVELEQAIILEEMRDNGGDVAWEGLLEIAYGMQSIARPIIGFEETVSEFNLDNVVSFMKKNYVSSNMTLGITGNLVPEEIIPKIECYLGKISEGQKIIDPKLEYSGGEIQDRCKCERGFMYFAAPIANLDNKHWASDKMLMHILGGSPSSRLFKKLREERGLVYSTWAREYDAFDQRFGVVMADGMAKNSKELAELVWDEIHTLQFDITEPELKRAVKEVSTEWLMDDDDPSQRAFENTYSLLRLGRSTSTQEDISCLNKLTVDEVRASAGRFIKHDISLSAHGQRRHLPDLSELKKRTVKTNEERTAA